MVPRWSKCRSHRGFRAPSLIVSGLMDNFAVERPRCARRSPRRYTHDGLAGDGLS
jgi:hypothetical protein